MIIRSQKNIYYILKIIIVTALAAFILSSCSSTKYIPPDKSIYKSSKITFYQKPDKYNVSALRRELIRLYPQQANGSFLFIPREYVYFKNLPRDGESGIRSWLRNNIGEEPAYYDDSLSELTAANMQRFLKLKRGFYDAEVTYNTSTENKYTRVEYIVNTGVRYTIGKIQYLCDDQSLFEDIKLDLPFSLIKTGDPIDADIFEAEKSRISIALQNRGYVEFSNQYIDIKGDSSKNNHQVDILIEIYPPYNEKTHRKYTVGEIKVFTDFNTRQDTSDLTKKTIGNTLFFKESIDFLVRPEMLFNSIYLKSGEIAKRNDRLKTLKKLNSLSAYRFMSVTPLLNPSDSNKIDYNIFLTPHNYNWVVDAGTGIFYSTINQASKRVLGLGSNVEFQHRNILKGSEKFTVNLGLSTEFETDPFLVRTLNLNFQNTLELPYIKDVFDFLGIIRKVGLLNSKYYNVIQEEGVTNFNLGFNYIDLLNFYKINSFNFSVGFRSPLTANKSITITPFGINLNQFFLEPLFKDSIVGGNEFFIRSFNDNLLTGFIFRDLLYLYTYKKPNLNLGFIGNLEISGLETFLANRFFNLVSGMDDIWTVGGSENPIRFSKFVKLDLDGRYLKSFSKKSSLAARLNMGIIIPYGESKENPYIKQFFVGGPNSLRAWNPRFLGPGSYQDPNPSVIIPFQQGDIRLEANLEYRLKLFWYVELGLFVDVGNIWLLQGDTNRPGAVFSSNFLNELAVGAGYGIRFNNNYFVIRLDFGYKLRDPYTDENGRHWYTWERIRAQRFGNLQLAVNYPF